MDTFKQISGRIAPMLEPNIDTDVIMPTQTAEKAGQTRSKYQKIIA